MEPDHPSLDAVRREMPDRRTGEHEDDDRERLSERVREVDSDAEAETGRERFPNG